MNFETSIVREDAFEDESRVRRRRAIVIGVIVLAIAAALAFAMFGRKSGGTAAGDNPAAQKQQAPHVTVVVPGRVQVSRIISSTGTLAARREMPVGVVGEGGRVTRVLVEPGQWVKAGQVLATIERSVQSEQAAALAAQINVAKADAELAQSQLDRAQKLVSSGFISRADLEQKKATRDGALARVRVAEAQLAQQRASNGRLDIRAPEAGLILTRAVEPGQVVSPASATLFRIAKGGEMEMRAQLAEGDLAQIHTGARAKVTPVGSSNSFDGQVWQVSPVIDPQTRQGIVRIALAYQPAIRPGGFALADIYTGSVDAPVLPESAVLSDQNGNYVYVIGPDNKVIRQPVKTGQVSDAGIAIVSGLNGTEKVVLSAGAFLNPGETVIPQRAAARR